MVTVGPRQIRYEVRMSDFYPFRMVVLTRCTPPSTKGCCNLDNSSGVCKL